MSNNLEKLKEVKAKTWITLLVVAVIIGLVVQFAYILGGSNACKNGGGQLLNGECTNVEVLGLCEHEGNLYEPIEPVDTVSVPGDPNFIGPLQQP